MVSEKVTYRLAQKPGSYVILKYVRKAAKLKDTGKLICAPAPPSVIEKSCADVSFLAGMLVDKFRYHLPLYRQHQRLMDGGIQISRGSLSGLVHRTVDLLEPVYFALLSSILQSQVLTMDETPIKASRLKGKMKTGYFWAVYGDRDEVAFLFAPTRASPIVKETLGAFCGVLVSDGYQVYEKYAAKVEEIEHAQCWAHTRRKFVEAQDVEPKLSTTALDRIGQLYVNEEVIRENRLTEAAKASYRQERSAPIVEAFFSWLSGTSQEKALLPSNPFTRAASYALQRQEALRVFLHNPNVPIDTNHIERQMRAIAMGRKNWMFCWTEIGARYAGMAQSLISSCRLHGIDPYTYLVDVLQRIDRHPAYEVQQLIPRNWKTLFGQNPLRSDADPRKRA
jgi:transposase